MEALAMPAEALRDEKTKKAGLRQRLHALTGPTSIPVDLLRLGSEDALGDI
jgi:hypothetical protein